MKYTSTIHIRLLNTSNNKEDFEVVKAAPSNIHPNIYLVKYHDIYEYVDAPTGLCICTSKTIKELNKIFNERNLLVAYLKILTHESYLKNKELLTKYLKRNK